MKKKKPENVLCDEMNLCVILNVIKWMKVLKITKFDFCFTKKKNSENKKILQGTFSIEMLPM